MTTDEGIEDVRNMATHPAAKLIFQQWTNKELFGGKVGGMLYRLISQIGAGEIDGQGAAEELSKHIKATPWRGGSSVKHLNLQREALIQLRAELQELVDKPEYHAQDEAVIALHLRGEQDFSRALTAVLAMDPERIRGLVEEQAQEHFVQTARWLAAAQWYDRNIGSLEALAAARQMATETQKKATAMLKAAAIYRLRHGDAEADVARRAGVDRQTVRAWAGKQPMNRS